MQTWLFDIRQCVKPIFCRHQFPIFLFAYCYSIHIPTLPKTTNSGNTAIFLRYTTVHLWYTHTTMHQSIKSPNPQRKEYPEMPTDITDAELQNLISDGLSQNEIARRTNNPRSRS